jgi:hypothetical protein
MPRCKKKQALLAQDLPIMKFNPRMRVELSPTGYLDIFKRILMCKIQGLRSPRNRSLLDVSEDFEDKRNAEIYH